MTEDNRVFTESQEELLKAALNRLIPAENNFPGAGDLELASYIDSVAAGVARLDPALPDWPGLYRDNRPRRHSAAVSAPCRRSSRTRYSAGRSGSAPNSSTPWSYTHTTATTHSPRSSPGSGTRPARPSHAAIRCNPSTCGYWTVSAVVARYTKRYKPAGTIARSTAIGGVRR